jgi:hypothetical protein
LAHAPHATIIERRHLERLSPTALRSVVGEHPNCGLRHSAGRGEREHADLSQQAGAVDAPDLVERDLPRLAVERRMVFGSRSLSWDRARRARHRTAAGHLPFPLGPVEVVLERLREKWLSAMALNASAHPSQLDRAGVMIRLWPSTRISTRSSKPHCSMTRLGMRMPWELPIRTRLVFTLHPLVLTPASPPHQQDERHPAGKEPSRGLMRARRPQGHMPTVKTRIWVASVASITGQASKARAAPAPGFACGSPTSG